MPRFGRNETALSEVLGTVLLLGITVVAFVGLALAVNERLETNPPPPNARFDLLHEGPNMTMVHRWGEPVAVDELRFIFEKDGVRTEVELTPLPALNEARGGSDKTWDLGEDLQVICRAQDACIGKGQSGAGLLLVHMPSQTLLHQHVEGT